MTDSEKLEKLAEWFDAHDAKRGIKDTAVQDDLRRIAKRLIELEKAAKATCDGSLGDFWKREMGG